MSVCNSGYFIQIKNLYVFIAYDNDDIDEKPFTISDIRIHIASPVYQFNVPCRDMIFANLKFFNFEYS